MKGESTHRFTLLVQMAASAINTCQGDGQGDNGQLNKRVGGANIFLRFDNFLINCASVLGHGRKVGDSQDNCMQKSSPSLGNFSSSSWRLSNLSREIPAGQIKKY